MNTYNPEYIEYKSPSMLVNNIRYKIYYYNPPPTITSHYPPDILDIISRKSNRLRLKIVTKVNGKDVLWGPPAYSKLAV